MSTYLPNPSVAPLVADFGSFSTKLGFAGEDHPSAIYHSSTAALRNDASQPARLASPPRRDFVTRTLESQDDGDYTIVNPVDPTTGWLYSRPGQCASSSSLCSNDTAAPSDSWESFELLNHYMSHSFNYLGIENRASHPLIVLDKSHTPPPLRQRMIEVLFEQNSLPAVFLLRDAIAACYAVGRTTATVVDCGYSSTTVTPVYEGFVERRGIRRNNACGARDVDERILQMMDGLVAGAGRKRKDRLKRINAKKMMAEGGAGGGGEQFSPSKHKKRDSSGHFVKRSSMVNEYPIPDYLMPIYQVRRAPLYNTRKDEFHNWSRMALARELREGGLGAAVGSMGYVSSQAGGEGNTSNPMFMTSNKVPYTLPDGTNVEITANARCDVAELYFGNDPYNTAYRERVLDETKAKLDEYVTEVDEYCNAWEPSENDKKALASAGNAPGAGDAFSTTSYRGEKSSKHGGRRARSATYSPATISAKLFSACLPYLRTAPPKSSADPMDAGGTGSTTSTTLDDERCFNYLTSVPPAQMVCDSAFRCDRDQQGALLGNVVVCGGGACLPGIGGALGAPGVAAAGSLGQLNEDAFPDRLREEIEAIVHQHTLGWRVKVTSPNMTERSICSWLGGSILGSLGTFQDMWISKQDYEEYGSAIVNRKCP